MVIKASEGAEIRALVAALGGGDEVRREAAIARLAIIGAPAIDRLIAAYKRTRDGDARTGILRALEPGADARALPIVRQAIATGGDEAIAGAAVLGRLLESRDRTAAVEALDALMSLALDSTAERRVRRAAFEAMRELPPEVRNRVIARLEADAVVPTAGTNDVHAAVWGDAVDGRLPDNAAVLRQAIDARAAAAPLGEVQKLIVRVRAREEATGAAAARAAWLGVRGSLHQALALRHSRIALYDLRESLEGATVPLPSSFLAALHAVGDASCLPPVAAAHAAAAPGSWRQQLEAAFDAIAKRERITKRHSVMKRIVARWPEIARR